MVDGNQEPFLVSHLDREDENRLGLAQVACHVKTGGRLLLGTQGPHYKYSKTVSNGMIYSQNIEKTESGFIKNYQLSDKSQIVMSQTINYRTYSWSSALNLLAEQGFVTVSVTHQSEQFMVFVKA